MFSYNIFIMKSKKKYKKNKSIRQKIKNDKKIYGGVLTPSQKIVKIKLDKINNSDDRLNLLNAECSTIDFEYSPCYRVAFIGATTNFFKLGYTTIRELMKISEDKRPTLTLGLPQGVKSIPEIVRDIAPPNHKPNLLFRNWTMSSREVPLTEEQELASLIQFFNGSYSAFLVPPIQDRIKYGKLYARAIIAAKIKRAVMIGVQYTPDYCHKIGIPLPCIGRDSYELFNEMDKILIEHDHNDFKYVCLNLPMFLENLLYQEKRLKNYNSFAWPQNVCSPFAYITSEDVGKISAQFLSNFDNTLEKIPEKFYNRVNKFRIEMTFAAGVTTAGNVCRLFSKYLKRPITYYEQTLPNFKQELKDYLEKDDEFAQQIVDLHNLIDNGHDIIEHVIQYETLNLGLSENEDIEKWISDRANCFINEAKCTYPLPPENHQAPLPSHNISVYTVF
jgi:hypothetical protein